ncbi:Outer membrane lipoprotein-sorting protein [Sinosporangium album]|uniref:Outer membrane lipoprotein-sorting protein n=1 Tax=Sinosporangium album TaxID=504805 RepID=A0A1G8G3R7_9ACTN|nr:Outer membrane lipoprotein-sorting protein [Sinosporangium album]
MPLAAVAVVAAAAGAGPVIATVRGAPALPERTAEQVIADMFRRTAEHARLPLSGTIVKTASLGIPGLPQSADGRHGGQTTSPAELLAGAHQFKIWYGGADRIRIARSEPMSEANLIAKGREGWLWESSADTATRVTLPGAGAPSPATTASPLATAASSLATTGSSLAAAAVTPVQAARHVLELIGGDTHVTVDDGEVVAGRAAYRLVLVPKSPDSLVEEVRLALDGENFIPLRLQVVAKGSAEPAIEFGFSEITFSPPAEENFTFTPPPGVTVKEMELSADTLKELGAERVPGKAPEGRATHIGTGWTTVASLPFNDRDLLAALWPAGADSESEPRRLVASVLNSGTKVSGPWGSGRLISTKLLTVLITDDGRLLVGAVTPKALTEAAGRL